MGRRKLRSPSPSPSKSKAKAKKSRSSSPPLSFEKNPFWEIFGDESNHASIGIDGDNDSENVHDGSSVVVDEENGGGCGNQVDHVFDDMLQFMELSKKTKPGHPMITDDVADTKTGQEENEILIERVVQSLLTHMRKFDRTSVNSSKCNEQSSDRMAVTAAAAATTTTLNVFVSAESIARLLLPWSVKGISQNSFKKKSLSSSEPPSPVVVSPFSKSLELLYWKTLDECLCFFLDRSEKEQVRGGKASKDRTRKNSLNLLTLSTMHKLVPVALRFALQQNDVAEEKTNKNAVSEGTVQKVAKTCYCRLVDHLYRPPFDVVCDNLLPILTRDYVKSSDSKLTTIWLSVTISTLQLMNLRLTNANPKKSFQLLVRPNVFLDLAVVHRSASTFKQSQAADIASLKEHLQSLQSIFKDLTRNAIFSLEHHMDGFRSLQLAISAFEKASQNQKGDNEKVAISTSSSAKSSFRGYQEGLFNTLKGFLIPCDKDKDDDDDVVFSFKDAATISSMLPLFLDIFLEQVSKMQKQQTASSKSHKKSKATDKLGHLQFRFFSCLSGYLLKGLILSKGDVVRMQMQDSRLRLSFFEMLGKNLDLLMRYNIYQPSLGNNMERSFLEKIGKETIQSMTAQGEEIGSKISFAEWKKSLMILDVLIQLNHTILHDHLAEILARCLTYDSNNETNFDGSGICDEASTFLITIIATYGRLRQLDYFYICLFDAVKSLSRQNDFQRIIQHLAFANDIRVSTHLGKAIQGSPIQQLKQIFSNVNDSIVSRSYSEGNQISQEVTRVASTVVTKTLVGLLRNVLVDSNSFNDVYPICNDIINGSVVSLMGSDGVKDTGNMKNAIMICAWTMHLKNRCEFWIDKKGTESSNNESSGIPSTLHRVLKDAITSAGDYAPENKKDDPDLLESLKFLACQRIQQLHGECYEKQRLAYATDAEQYSTASENSEARQLVGFILQRHDSNESDAKSISKMMDQWAILAESIAIWAPHADQNTIDSFLNQLLEAVVIVDESCRRKRNLLLSLLNDTSFYEIPNVSRRLGINVASFVAENVQKVLSRCDGSSLQQINIACPTLRPGWKGLSVEEVTNVHHSGNFLTCDSKDLLEIYKFLRGSLRVLDKINNIGIPIWEECEDASKVFQSIMGMESICNILRISNERSFLDTKVRLISALRTTASRVLTRIPFDSDGPIFETQEKDYLMLLPHILENSFKSIDHDSSSTTMHQCINSCNLIVGSLVNKCIALGTKSTMYMIKVLDSTFDQAEVTRGRFQYLILTNYAAALLRKFGRLFGAVDDTTTMEEISRVIKKRIWKTSQECCFNTSDDAQFLFQNQSTIFIAEALRLSSICYETQLIPLGSVENKIVVRLRNLLTSDSEEHETRSISYLVGCLAMAKPSRIVREELANELLLANLKGYDTFLTPLCMLARGMETDEFDELLNKLTSKIVEVPATAIKLRIVHMIVLSSTNQSQIDVLSNHSAMIMNNCLQVMTQVARQIDVNSDSILEVSSLIVDMASKKDLMVLRERDIALILARITSTIRVSEEPGEGETTDIQLKGYDASFSLVSLFLQRFSKQVHNCVPSLVIALTTMLQFALCKSLHTNSMSYCGQKFSRLCELLLPHADVYKKHVICLILRFVNSLRQNIHPACKKSLLPGIYCLLDIIQDHETMQLNSMLDEECRAILRSVHEGYKKIHVYKGQ
jgi:hypothetical protein